MTTNSVLKKNCLKIFIMKTSLKITWRLRIFSAGKALLSFVCHWEGRRNKGWARCWQGFFFQRLFSHIIKTRYFNLAVHLMRGSVLIYVCILPSHSWWQKGTVLQGAPLCCASEMLQHEQIATLLDWTKSEKESAVCATPSWMVLLNGFYQPDLVCWTFCTGFALIPKWECISKVFYE